MNLIKNRLSEMIHVFGYAKHPSMPDNPTGFFDFDKDEPNAKKFNSFREINENMIDWASTLNEEDMESFSYQMSDESKEVPLMTFTSSVKACKATLHQSSMKLYGKPMCKCD